MNKSTNGGGPSFDIKKGTVEMTMAAYNFSFWPWGIDVIFDKGFDIVSADENAGVETCRIV